jgi:regulator of sirC expression with transglutaminase-like and TPR domain
MEMFKLQDDNTCDDSEEEFRTFEEKYHIIMTEIERSRHFYSLGNEEYEYNTLEEDMEKYLSEELTLDERIAIFLELLQRKVEAKINFFWALSS